MKLATKLFGSFVLVLALMIGLGTYAIVQLGTVNASTVDLATNWMPSVKDILSSKANINRIRVLQFRLIVDQDPAAIDSAIKESNERIASTRALWADYSKLVVSPEERQLFETTKSNLEAFFAAHAQMITLRSHSKTEEAKAVLDGEALKYYNDIREATDRLSEMNINGGNQAAEEAAKVYGSARAWVVGALLACAVLALLMALMITRSLVKQLGGEPAYVAEIANNVASGNLSLAIQVKAGDTGSVLMAMKTMVDRLSQVVSEVNGGAEALAGASEEVSATAQSL
ncbi:MCP four helix bundle domain-containing protein, partial [Aquabacterium soli]